MRKADTTLPPSCAVVMKSGNPNFLEPSGPLLACNGTALSFLLRVVSGLAKHEKCSTQNGYVTVARVCSSRIHDHNCSYFFALYPSVYFHSWSWPLLPPHCKFRALLLHLITLNNTHTHTHGRTPLGEGSARRIDLYLQEAQHSQETYIRAPSEIRTRNPSKRPVADRDQQIVFFK